MKHNDKGLSVFGLTMLALGTVIGASFFLGSAIPIMESGPSVIFVFLFGGLLVYFILFSLSELTVNNPTTGSFRTYAENAYGKIAGFVVGWVYWTGLVIAMSSEAVAVSFLLQIFFPNVAVPIIGSIVLVLIVIINLLGTDKLSLLENTLAGVKTLTIVAFIVIAIGLITGAIGNQPIGVGAIKHEPFFKGGITGLLGSTLVVLFSYAGFEIVGLAATETKNPEKKIPRAILFTVLSLIGLYILAISVLLPLIPVDLISEEKSPFVAALLYHNISFIARIINVVLIIAVLSTMLAATFGVARMLRSLADDHYAPQFLKDNGDIPYKGIIFSGIGMFLFFSLSFFLPKGVYLFLVSSSGFAILYTYLLIVLSHYKYRKKITCQNNCQLPLFPYSSYFTIFSLILIMISMPFVEGQLMGLIAGVTLVLFYSLLYLLFIKPKSNNL